MYNDYWQLNCRPFDNDFDTAWLFTSRSAEECMVRLLYCVNEHKNFAMLTGPHGGGKSYLLRYLRQQLQTTGYRVVLLDQPNLGPIEFLQDLVFGLQSSLRSERKIDLLHEMQRLLQEDGQKDREWVIMIDEAQSITDPATWEEIRFLLNLEMQGKNTISVILSGHPPLWEKVEEISAMSDRLGVHCELNVLGADEANLYLQHRLGKAGSTKHVFAPDAVQALHKASYGLPRQLNRLADLSLLVAAGRGLGSVDASCVSEAIEDLVPAEQKAA